MVICTSYNFPILPLSVLSTYLPLLYSPCLLTPCYLPLYLHDLHPVFVPPPSLYHLCYALVGTLRAMCAKIILPSQLMTWWDKVLGVRSIDIAQHSKAPR